MRGELARLDGIVAWPIEHMVVGHGSCVEGDGAAFVRQAFRGYSGATA